MGALEIVLLAAGAVIFIVSFIAPVKKEKLSEDAAKVAEGEIRTLVEREVENTRSRLTEISEEELQQQIEESERTMERISNEKIMAVNEYSDTVLEEIHKNHEEVVFLYDMLKDRKEKLTESFGTADKDIKELLQKVKDAEITVKEDLAAYEEKHNELAEFRDELAKTREDMEETRKELDETKKDLEETRKNLAEKEKNIREGQEAAQSAISALKATQQASAVSAEDGKEEGIFMPFNPPKVEAAPKKAGAEKPVRKKKISLAEKTERAFAEKKKAEKEQGAGVDLLLTSEQGKSSEPNSNERILELHNAGKSNMAIAKELGLGIGEVKLVIDLYESRL